MNDRCTDDSPPAGRERVVDVRHASQVAVSPEGDLIISEPTADGWTVDTRIRFGSASIAVEFALDALEAVGNQVAGVDR